MKQPRLTTIVTKIGVYDAEANLIKSVDVNEDGTHEPITLHAGQFFVETILHPNGSYTISAPTKADDA